MQREAVSIADLSRADGTSVGGAHLSARVHSCLLGFFPRLELNEAETPAKQGSDALGFQPIRWQEESAEQPWLATLWASGVPQVITTLQISKLLKELQDCAFAHSRVHVSHIQTVL